MGTNTGIVHGTCPTLEGTAAIAASAEAVMNVVVVSRFRANSFTIATDGGGVGSEVRSFNKGVAFFFICN
jgi:hypothetical protein